MTAISELVFKGLVSFGVSGSFVIGGVNLMPTSLDATTDYFEVHAISAERLGETATLKVNRTISKPITMSPTVRIMERGNIGWREYCIAEGPSIEYRPEAELPDPTPLSWWTWGKCPTLPEGDAQIWTTWRPVRGDLAPLSYVLDVPEAQPK
jgi:hypothetical protein